MEYKEFIALLKQEQTTDTLNRRREEIAELMPSLRVMFDFDQCNHAHPYDLWQHCLHTAIGLPRGLEDDMLYLAALLHDIGKPDCQVSDRNPEKRDKHYPNHPERSAEILLEHILPELESSGVWLNEDEKRRLYYYVYYHDDRIKLKQSHVDRHLSMVSIEEFQNLMRLEVADALAHVQLPLIQERVRVCGILSKLSEEELYHVESLTL